MKQKLKPPPRRSDSSSMWLTVGNSVKNIKLKPSAIASSSNLSILQHRKDLSDLQNIQEASCSLETGAVRTDEVSLKSVEVGGSNVNNICDSALGIVSESNDQKFQFESAFSSSAISAEPAPVLIVPSITPTFLRRKRRKSLQAAKSVVNTQRTRRKTMLPFSLPIAGTGSPSGPLESSHPLPRVYNNTSPLPEPHLTSTPLLVAPSHVEAAGSPSQRKRAAVVSLDHLILSSTEQTTTYTASSNLASSFSTLASLLPLSSHVSTTSSLSTSTSANSSSSLPINVSERVERRRRTLRSSISDRVTRSISDRVTRSATPLSPQLPTKNEYQDTSYSNTISKVPIALESDNKAYEQPTRAQEAVAEESTGASRGNNTLPNLAADSSSQMSSTHTEPSALLSSRKEQQAAAATTTVVAEASKSTQSDGQVVPVVQSSALPTTLSKRELRPRASRLLSDSQVELHPEIKAAEPQQLSASIVSVQALSAAEVEEVFKIVVPEEILTTALPLEAVKIKAKRGRRASLPSDMRENVLSQKRAEQESQQVDKLKKMKVLRRAIGDDLVARFKSEARLLESNLNKDAFEPPDSPLTSNVECSSDIPVSNIIPQILFSSDLTLAERVKKSSRRSSLPSATRSVDIPLTVKRKNDRSSTQSANRAKEVPASAVVAPAKSVDITSLVEFPILPTRNSKFGSRTLESSSGLSAKENMRSEPSKASRQEKRAFVPIVNLLEASPKHHADKNSGVVTLESPRGKLTSPSKSVAQKLLLQESEIARANPNIVLYPTPANQAERFCNACLMGLYVSNRSLFTKKDQNECREYANQEWNLLKQQTGSTFAASAEQYIRNQEAAFRDASSRSVLNSAPSLSFTSLQTESPSLPMGSQMSDAALADNSSTSSTSSSLASSLLPMCSVSSISTALPLAFSSSFSASILSFPAILPLSQSVAASSKPFSPPSKRGRKTADDEISNNIANTLSLRPENTSQIHTKRHATRTNVTLPEIPVYCICQRPAGQLAMLQCQECKEWFHLRCLGLKKKALPELIHQYVCRRCNPKFVISVDQEEYEEQLDWFDFNIITGENTHSILKPAILLSKSSTNEQKKVLSDASLLLSSSSSSSSDSLLSTTSLTSSNIPPFYTSSSSSSSSSASALSSSSLPFRNEFQKKKVQFCSKVFERRFGREQMGSSGVPISGGYSLGLGWEVLDEGEAGLNDEAELVLVESAGSCASGNEEIQGATNSISSEAISNTISKDSGVSDKIDGNSNYTCTSSSAVFCSVPPRVRKRLPCSKSSELLRPLSEEARKLLLVEDKVKEVSVESTEPAGTRQEESITRNQLIESERAELDAIRASRCNQFCQCDGLDMLCTNNPTCPCNAEGVKCHTEKGACMCGPRCKNPNGVYRYNKTKVSKERLRAMQLDNLQDGRTRSNGNVMSSLQESMNCVKSGNNILNRSSDTLELGHTLSASMNPRSLNFMLNPALFHVVN